MKWVDAILEYFFILTSPLLAVVIWSTRDMQFLRFFAAIWLISTVLESIRDRYRAALGAQEKDNG